MRKSNHFTTFVNSTSIKSCFSMTTFYIGFCHCQLHEVWPQQTFVLMKTSSRRLDQDEYVRLSLTSSEDVFKTSSKRLQDLFKASSRRLQDVLKTSSRCLRDVFKTSSRLPSKISSRRFQGMPSS